jgi:peptidyl-prolyl cis-trans isomerase B (cyclophilin B)
MKKLIAFAMILMLLGAAFAETTYPIATIEMENGDVMKLELYPDIAPISVENFVKLAKDGFYDGLTFHRIVPGFVIQGGDPTGTGMGGPGWHITGEFASNGIRNDLKHTRGVLSWARSMDPNSAGSQFFIMVDDAPHLDGDYAAFGKVTEGIDLVDAIVKGMYGRKPVMKTISIDE